MKAVGLSNFCINGVRKSLPETRLHLAFLNIPLVHKLWLRARKKKGKKTKQNKIKSKSASGTNSSRYKNTSCFSSF